MTDLSKILNFSRTFSAPYHPAGNGLVERTIQTVKSSLGALLVNRSKASWSNYLTQIEMALRCTNSSTTGFSPFEVLFVKPMRVPLVSEYYLATESGNTPDVAQRQKALKKIQDVVRSNIKKKAEEMKNERKEACEPVKLKPGDLVMVKKLSGQKRIFENRYAGPYRINGKVKEMTFVLADNEGNKLIRHRDHLKQTGLNMESKIAQRETSESQSSNHQVLSIHNSHNQNSPSLDVRTSSRPRRNRKPVIRFGFN